MDKEKAKQFDETQSKYFEEKGFTPCHREWDNIYTLINPKLSSRVKNEVELTIATVDILDESGDVWDNESEICYVVSESWLRKYYRKYIKNTGDYESFTDFMDTYDVEEIGMTMYEQAKADNVIVEYIGIISKE